MGREILSFEVTKEEFLNLITSIILSRYGGYKVKLEQDKKKHMCLFGIKRRGRKKEFRVFIKDDPLISNYIRRRDNAYSINGCKN